MQIPSINTIEFTNACNFNCAYCQRNNEDGKRPIAFLDPSLVRKLIGEGAFENTAYIEFQQNGEPTLHPQFAELVTMIREQVPYIGMSTNATFIRKADEAMLHAVRSMDLITISIHPQTRLEDIINVSQALEDSRTRIRVQMLEEETYDIDMGALSCLRNISIDNYPLRVFGCNYGKKRFCADLHYGVTIQADGDVVPCCNVVGKQKVLGNVCKDSLADIWANSDHKMFEYCKTCRTPSPFAHRLSFFDTSIN